jgi:FtsZ-binding cell division protein ZapB
MLPSIQPLLPPFSFNYLKENNKGMQEQTYNTQFNVEIHNKKEKQKNKTSTMKEYIKTYLGNGENIVETFWHKRYTIAIHHTK